MKLCGVDKKNIGRIYVTKGPGGFTGVKIAILIAKA
jgi:tRNA A37 threonylcarbamoyladenosine modification protein TsaB